MLSTAGGEGRAIGRDEGMVRYGERRCQGGREGRRKGRIEGEYKEGRERGRGRAE